MGSGSSGIRFAGATEILRTLTNLNQTTVSELPSSSYLAALTAAVARATDPPACCHCIPADAAAARSAIIPASNSPTSPDDATLRDDSVNNLTVNVVAQFTLISFFRFSPETRPATRRKGNEK